MCTIDLPEVDKSFKMFIPPPELDEKEDLANYLKNIKLLVNDGTEWNTGDILDYDRETLTLRTLIPSSTKRYLSLSVYVRFVCVRFVYVWFVCVCGLCLPMRVAHI